MQDPCGRLPAPDSYAGSAAPSIAGVGGHPTQFSPTQGVASDIDDSYACQRGLRHFPGLISRFWERMANRHFAGLRPGPARDMRHVRIFASIGLCMSIQSLGLLIYTAFDTKSYR